MSEPIPFSKDWLLENELIHRAAYSHEPYVNSLYKRKELKTIFEGAKRLEVNLNGI